MKSLIFISIILFQLSSIYTIAIPTLPQIEYQNAELGAIIHFSSNTYGEYQGCDQNNWEKINDSKIFNPDSLDVESWIQAASAFGAKYAVLTAKHQCGFCLWPTNITIPTDSSNFTYNYSISYSPWKTDIVKEFFEACKKYNIRPGLYYSVNDNFFLNIKEGKQDLSIPLPGQVKITPENYKKIMLQQVEELWKTYAQDASNLPLELWFDGGYSEETKNEIKSLINQYASKSVAFNGYGISENPTRWCGNEYGYANDPNWSTGTTNSGDPGSDIFNPAEVDVTLQENDQWFYIKNYRVHPVEDLIGVYHRSVGLNANMILDIAVPPSGKIDPVHMNRYIEFGQALRKCYYGLALKSVTSKDNKEVYLNFTQSILVDRVIIMENQEKNGQLIRNFEVFTLKDNVWISQKKGQSIGHKRIVLFNETLTNSVKVVIDKTQEISLEARYCGQKTNENINLIE